MNNKRICMQCEHWSPGIPCGTCIHPKSHFLATNDTMVFYDAGNLCPLNKENVRKTYIEKNPGEIIFHMREYMKCLGIKGAVIGISGGKDSTIVAKLMVECLGKENVLGVLMPNGEQSDIEDSVKVVELLDIEAITVNIQNAFNGLVESTTRELQYLGKELSKPSYINIAPRIRMTTLYAIAQSMGNGWRVIGTTNKSEEYIGWLTKWGDGAADFEPIIDFTVTELHQLGLNLGLPKELVRKIPVDGLAEGSDEERFGFTYEQLDTFIEKGTTGNVDIDEKISTMHKNSEHKRLDIPHYKLPHN